MLGAAALACLAASPAMAKSFGPWGPPVSAEVGSDPMLNTTANDGCPILSPDGLDLYMASNRDGSIKKGDGTNSLDIWVAHRASTSDGWGAPEPLRAPVNSAADDFCPDPVRGHGLFFVSKRDDPNGDIYHTRLGPNGWEVPERLGPNINSPQQEWSPSYFEDENGTPTLYFSSTRAGTQDIYASVDWQPAQPVTELNTAADDSRPNVRHDGLEIVFDSTRGAGNPAQNLGGPDIWTAERSSTAAPWSAPEHLAGLSSPAPDTRASLSWDGETMVFGSARSGSEGGSTDIYVTHRSRDDGRGKVVTFPGH